MSGWTWAAASRRGTSHVRAGTRRQDGFACRTAADKSTLIVAVSDGAGSASHGGEGASLVVRILMDEAQRHCHLTDEAPEDDVLWTWLDLVRDRIGLAAERRSLSMRDFSATAVAVIVGARETTIAHVGDGAVVLRDDHGLWSAASWPDQGEYASTTYFVTDEPVAKLRIIRLESRPSAVAVFTDGIERIALNLSTSTAHGPFFDGVIAPVERSAAVGRDMALSAALGRYLDSPAVNERTDDDKTLVLAVRR